MDVVYGIDIAFSCSMFYLILKPAEKQCILLNTIISCFQERQGISDKRTPGLLFYCFSR